MDIRNFTKTFLENIKSGNQVLDLGAGEGKFSQMFLEKGAIVTAVDTKPPAFSDLSLIVKKMSIEDFCVNENNAKYDFVFARNVIQFLDKGWVFEDLFPWIEEHLAKEGIVAIETFYQEPEPAFNHPTPSVYKLNELRSYFMNWKELYAVEDSNLGFDMDGHTRKFFISSLIAQNKN